MTQTPQVQLETKSCGKIALLVTRYYRHLGGVVHGKGSMGVEVVTRSAQACGAAQRLHKYLKGTGSENVKEVRQVANAISGSLLRLNCATGRS